MTEATSPATVQLSQERIDILELLQTHRHFLRFTAAGLTDEQAKATPTVSALSIGGLVKHVAETEEGWAKFVVDGPAGMQGDKDFSEWGPAEFEARANAFRLVDDETLADVLERYEAVAAATDELVRTLPDLDESQPLPAAPWFSPNARRSARRVFIHIAAETAQHAGHADIIRETLDGQKTMG